MENKSIFLLTVKPSEKSFLPIEEKRIPFDIATLVSYLKDNSYEVTLLDNNLQDNDWQNSIINASPDYIALYLSLESWANAKVYLDEIKSIKSEETKLIVFGPKATFNTNHIPDFVDFIIVGEPENAFIDILNGNVQNKIVDAKPIDNIDDLKLPAWQFFIPENNPYNCDYDLTEIKLGDIFPVFDLLTVRGDQKKLKCFSVNYTDDRPVSFMSVPKIIENIKYLVDQYDAKGIRFLDYNLAENKERLVALCNELKSFDNKVLWQCNVMPGSVDLDTLTLMSEAGCKVININVISASRNVLTRIEADFTTEQVKDLFINAKELGMTTIANTIYCLPHETELDRKTTEAFLENLKSDYINRYIYLGITSSGFYQEVLNNPHRIDDNGLVVPFEWEGIANKFIGKTYFSGSYCDIPIASNPLPDLVFYKKHKYIEEKLEYLDQVPLKKKAYLYGAGKLAKCLIKKYKLQEFEIKGIFDAELSKGGRFRPTKFTVYHYTEIKKLKPDYIFITMASRDESIKVKNAIMTNIDLDKKPEVYSMFYEDV